jgi:hypothetical protein
MSFLWYCARNILTVHRETLTQYITFKRGGRGEQRKDIYIENRAGKAARLTSWRKMTQPGEFCW